MPAELALVAAPTPLWRVERIDPPLRFSRLNPGDAMNERAGNRFDVTGAGVLYAATAATGGYAETLTGFRPRASMVEAGAVNPAGVAAPYPLLVVANDVTRAHLSFSFSFSFSRGLIQLWPGFSPPLRSNIGPPAGQGPRPNTPDTSS